MAIREDMRVSAARSNDSRRIWYCRDSECGHRNWSEDGDQYGRPGCRTRRDSRRSGGR